MSAPMIELAQVSKSFGAHQVLRGVDLSVGQSECVPDRAERVRQEHAAAVREFSGALRFRRPSHRRPVDRLRGLERNAPADGARPLREMRREIGMVFQHFNLWPHMTALEQCRRAASAGSQTASSRSGGSRNGDATRVGLAAKADAYPSRLSGGQQQRVATPERSRCSLASCCSMSRPRRSIPSWSARFWR